MAAIAFPALPHPLGHFHHTQMPDTDAAAPLIHPHSPRQDKKLKRHSHKAPPTAWFLPVTGKTRFAAEAGLLRRYAPRNDK